MSNIFSEQFKIQAVQKTLSRSQGVSIKDIADSLGVGYSSLQRWIRQAQNNQLESTEFQELNAMSKEKRPQDWSLQERLEMIITCAALDEKSTSGLCRGKGVYPHHIKQWKSDFSSGTSGATTVKNQAQDRDLKKENKALKKELNRKEKALAEAAALLILQKKANQMWGYDEDDLQ